MVEDRADSRLPAFLASDLASPEYEVLLRAWMTMMASSAVSSEMLEHMRHAYANDVGVLPPEKIAALIAAGGFTLPTRFFQAGLIHAWCSRRAELATSSTGR
ncbi:hypothetical protein ASALC70_03524 [Alcanivorax sp. ALC70]|nr:hypothetical protein ASALC70_03524 [Alcanivorax sp. ALC70]